jgi:aldehyde dehydrogenase (NAD+)
MQRFSTPGRDRPGTALALLRKARSGASSLCSDCESSRQGARDENNHEALHRWGVRRIPGREVMDSINGMPDHPQAPWGGFKHLGVGREFGTLGIEAFLEPRAILE